MASSEEKEKEKEKENETEKKKGSLLVKLIILVVVLGALGGGGYFAYLKFFHHPKATAEQEKPKEKVLCEMDTFLVNLADAGGRRYLKASMKLELDNPLALVEIDKRNFELRDTILMLLSGKEFEDISSVGGKTGLKQEIMREVNRVLKQGQVVEVFFTEFIVQ